MLKNIPKINLDEQNKVMTDISIREEVKKVVFEMNGDSTHGPDSLFGHFFLTCWEIVGGDITNMVKPFFCVRQLPRFITHTNLVLIPKKSL